MQRIIFICFVTLIICLSLSAQTNKDEQALIQLEHDWAAAYLRHDTQTIARILANDFVGIDGRGIMTDKAGELEEAKAPGADAPLSDFTVLDDSITDMKVRLYGNVAIVNGISVEKVKIKDKESIVRFRRTTVWEKRRRRWQCVSFHGSRILEQSQTNSQPQTNPQPQSTPPVQTTQNQDEQEQIRRFREIVMRPVVQKIAGMEQVKIISNLDYAKSGSEFRKMDVYQPPNLAKNERLPAVVFIHGGASERFTPKDWGIYTSWGRLVAASGMIGVTFTHRLGFPKTMLDEGAGDVNSALNYIRTNADSLNIDRDRLCLIAFSAGGPMLSTAMREKPAYIRCLVAYYAFMDVQQSDVHKQSETPETVRKFSNITYLSLPDANKIAPLLVARAGQDEIPTMNDSIDRFIQAAIAKNLAITVVNHPGGSHGFDNRNDDERSREIIRQTLEFMKLHLGLNISK